MIPNNAWPVSREIILDRFLSESEFVCDNDSLGTILITSPKDVECSEQDTINVFAERMTRCWRLLDPRFRLYQYWFRRKGELGLFVNSTFQILMLTTGAWSDRPAIFPQWIRKVIRKELAESRALLAQKVKSWTEQCQDFLPVRAASKQEGFELLWSIFNPGGKPRPLLGNMELGKQVAPEIHFSPTEGLPGWIAGNREIVIGGRYASMLSLQYLPSDAGKLGYPSTTPYMLGPLASLEHEFTLCVQAQPIPIANQRSRVKWAKMSQQEQEVGIGAKPEAHIADRNRNQEAVRKNEAISQMQAEIASGTALSQFCLTVMVHDESREGCRTAAEAVKSAMDLSCRMHIERLRRRIMFFAMCPGMYRLARFRERKVSAANLADFSVLFGSDCGNPYSAHLKQAAVRVLESRQHTPYYFNFHTGDVGHLFITGKTGSGKTVLSQVLLHDAQKYTPRPYTSITDLAGSYKNLTEICGGSYTRVQIGSDDARMNPLAWPDSKEQRDFTTSLVTLLVEQRGRKLDADEIEDVHQAVIRFYESDEPKRLGALSRFLPEPFQRPLRRWVEPGQYAWLLDNEESRINSSDFQAHEFVGMDDESHRELLEPLFMSKFHMDTMRVRDPNRIGQLKILHFDEAWVAAQSARGIDYLRSSLKRARSYNAIVILATQSPKDASTSAIWPVVNQCCDKIMLADPEMTAEDYANDFGLHPKQVETVRGVMPKGELFVKRAGMEGKALKLNLTREEKWLYATDAPSVKIRREAMREHGENWLENLVNHHGGFPGGSQREGSGNGENHSDGLRNHRASLHAIPLRNGDRAS